MAELDPEKKGMSTTLSALLIRANLAFAVHVGDSRVYRVRGQAVLQMTEDHTLINYKVKHGMMTKAEAEKAAGKNVITRAVGHKDYVQVDTVDIDVARGDRFLLCSDGLHGYFTNDREVAELCSDGSLEECAESAVALANQRGGKDNITAVVIEVQSADPNLEPRADPSGESNADLHGEPNAGPRADAKVSAADDDDDLDDLDDDDDLDDLEDLDDLDDDLDDLDDDLDPASDKEQDKK
jgi:serine/threonine protein phosphatase PrpC